MKIFKITFLLLIVIITASALSFGSSAERIVKKGGFVYTLTENTENKIPYTGLVKSKTTGKRYYSINGEIQYGWRQIGGNRYYFKKKDGSAATGKINLYGVGYVFDKNGVWEEKELTWHELYNALAYADTRIHAGAYSYKICVVDEEKVKEFLDKVNPLEKDFISFKQVQYSQSDFDAITREISAKDVNHKFITFGQKTIENRYEAEVAEIDDEVLGIINSIKNNEIIDLSVIEGYPINLPD